MPITGIGSVGVADLVAGAYVRRAAGTSSLAATLPFVNVRDFDAKGDGVTDDTAAIQAALDWAVTSGGGHVWVPAGIYLCSPVQIGSRTTLYGSGPKTVLKMAAGSTAALFTFKADTNERVTLSNFAIDGNKTSQTSSAAGGINLVNTTSWTAIANLSTAGEGDPRHSLLDLFVYNAKGAGVTVSGRGEIRARNVQVLWADGAGIIVDAPDGYWDSCSTGGTGLEGFLLTGAGNTRFTNCKAYFAGQVDNTHGDGWSIQSNRVALVGCEGQDNRRHGLYISAVTNAFAVGFTADSNGTAINTASPTNGDGIYLDGCSLCILDVNAFDRVPNQPPYQNGTATQRYGISFNNTASKNQVRAVGTGNVTALHNDAYLNQFSSPGLFEWALSGGTAINIYSGTRSVSDSLFFNFGNRARIGYNGPTSDFYIDDNGSSKDVVFRRTNAETGRFGADGLTLAANKVLITGQSDTASRVAASAVGRGAQFYDITLGKPIWSDGTNWRDAAGNIV